MQEILFAPELSATSRYVRIWIMSISSRVLGRRRPAAAGPRALLRRPLQDLLDHPALVPGERARLLDAHPVADLALVLLVVRHEAGSPPQVLAIQRIHHQPLDLDDGGLVHLVADHDPVLLEPAALRFSLPFQELHHSLPVAGADSPAVFSRITVRTRASSLRTRAIFCGLSDCPVAFWNRSLKICSRSVCSRVLSSATSFSRSWFAFTCGIVRSPGARTSSEARSCGRRDAAPGGRSPRSRLPSRRARVRASPPPPSPPAPLPPCPCGSRPASS